MDGTLHVRHCAEYYSYLIKCDLNKNINHGLFYLLNLKDEKIGTWEIKIT